ncbi:FG-GAP-like repeat-containing protein [Planobispora siamensis]|uniref:Repeat domain-containing protein n=1 Tax=Planobispora siamensis TaxID=936338 RepID=A0A8J3SQN3_9ACTN|nr:VCBS repeat-containing protein [Planobispora siamensis]GIH96624.1 hypothetical protein Psi01_72540 [Planobispora siamensis]
MNTSVSSRFGMPGRRRAVSLLAAAALTSGALAATAAPASAVTVPVCATPGFAAPVTYPTANMVLFTATADFNNDHKADLATYGHGGGDIEVLTGNGDGTFDPAVGADPGMASASRLATGDITSDVDSSIDIVVADSASGTVRVLPGNGDGTFGAPITTPTILNASMVIPGDFDDDDRLDVLVTSGSNNNSIMLGNGDGTFKAPAPTGFTGYAPLAAVADFDGDGDDDVAFGDGSMMGTNGIEVFPSNGDGSFGLSTAYGAGTSALFVSTADFNGDHEADLISSGMGDGMVLLGNGDGSFQSALPYTGNGGLGWPTLGDYNGDGKTDAAFASPMGGSLLLGKGDGTFQAPVSFNGGSMGMDMVSGRFDADNRSDLATSSGLAQGVSVLLSTCGTSATPTPAVKPKPVVEPKPTVKPKPATKPALKWKTKVKLEKPKLEKAKLKKAKKIRGGGVK